MNECYLCDKAAQAICKFCGIFICKNHRDKKEYFTGFSTPWSFYWPKGLEINDASWCGKCSINYRRTI